MELLNNEKVVAILKFNKKCWTLKDGKVRKPKTHTAGYGFKGKENKTSKKYTENKMLNIWVKTGKI